MAFLGLPNSGTGANSYVAKTFQGETNGRTEFFTRIFTERTEAAAMTELFLHTGAGIEAVGERPTVGELWPRGSKTGAG